MWLRYSLIPISDRQTFGVDLYIPVARHAFVVVRGPEGQQFGVRGGPDGIMLRAQAAPFGPAFRDYNAQTVAGQLVLVTDRPYDEITADLSRFVDWVNRSNFRYSTLQLTNSNAVAFQAITVLGVPRPAPVVVAPGHSTVLEEPFRCPMICGTAP